MSDFFLGSWKEANSGKDFPLWISDRLGPLSCPSSTQIVFEVTVYCLVHTLLLGLGTGVTIKLL